MAILEVGNGKQFAAISQASAVAKPNDEIVIHAGTYRETIKPTQDGITYRAAGDGAVVVTGGTASGGQWGTNGAFIEDRKNIVIKGIQFKNLNQNLSGDPWGTGVAIIRGSGNRIEDCTIDNAKGYGISMYGSYSTVRNCTVTNAYWNAVDMRGDHDTLEYNTLSRSGQHLIFARGKSDIIRYNDLSDACRWEQDGGAIYTYGTDGKGTEISYNRINGGYNGPFIYGNPAYQRQLGGIMLDDGSSNFIVHHNVIWNSQCGIKIGTIGSPAVGHRIYNNTIWASSRGAFCTYGDGGLSDIKVYNNLVDNIPQGWVGTDVKNNLATTNPGFVDAANGNFQLQSGSPAIYKGLVISGLTDGYTGAAPDVGAYEFGKTWSAGASTRDGSR